MEITFLPLAIITVLALLAHFASKKVNAPVIVTEIFFGIIIGRNVLNLIGEDVAIEFLALLGFIFLMFLAGLEIDFNQIESRGWGDVFKGLLIFGLILSLSYLGATVILGHGILLALVLSTTSLGVVVPTLRSLNLTKGHEGQSILLTAMVADFLAVLMLTIYAVLVRDPLELKIYVGPVALSRVPIKLV
jgi:Kef-type K+ transport system membrane component KefB